MMEITGRGLCRSVRSRFRAAPPQA